MRKFSERNVNFCLNSKTTGLLFGIVKMQGPKLAFVNKLQLIMFIKDLIYTKILIFYVFIEKVLCRFVERLFSKIQLQTKWICPLRPNFIVGFEIYD